MSATRPHVVLGAGLAGLTLAHALLREGLRAPIVVVDRRRGWSRDRTWCWWDVRPTPYTELVSHRWASWRVVTERGATVQRSSRHPYLYLDSRRFYDTTVAALQAAPNVELRLGERVLDVRPDSRSPAVGTERELLEAERVYDAMASGSPLLRSRPPGEIELEQRFVGWEVEVDRPAFDPAVATLMDFRVDQADGVRFTYVLPFSSKRALVEDTSFGGRALTIAERREAIADWLDRCTEARAWTVTHEERGRLPMSTHRFALHRGERVHAIGAAAGAVRPSSGYAFARTQSHCAALARAVVRGEPLPQEMGTARHRALDHLFLRALCADPGAFRDHARRLAGIDSGAFARFMSGASSPLDEGRLIAALPKLPFLAATLPSLPGWSLAPRIVRAVLP